MKTFICVVAAVSLLTGCGASHLRTVQQAKQTLLGATGETLSACIGEPQSVSTGPHGTVWRYSSAQATDGDGRTQLRPPADPRVDRRACVFDFTIENGRVVAIASENRAGWGFGSIANCSRLVRQCVGE